MTSNHCFSRIGRQNMRHSTWLWALSMIGNLLALPVVMLLATGENLERVNELNYLASCLSNLYFTNRVIVLAFAAIVASVGALVVGITNFRYLLHKNMVDTYHSIPVKRQTLFFVNWLNGFLIWFVPFALNLVLTMIISAAKAGSLMKRIRVLEKAQGYMGIYHDPSELSRYTIGGLLGGMLTDALLVLVVFLLIYHLTIVAMMLCGNVLNVLVTEVILGGGVMALYGVILALCEAFWDTFLTSVVTLHRGLQYASPFVSSVMMMVSRMNYYDDTAGFWGEWWTYLIVNGVIALALLCLAAFLYQRRPSELAEQGLRSKWAKYPLQILISMFAGIAGWWIFYFFSATTRDAYNTIWGCFGIVIGAVIIFGAMDVVNNMDFKAFFRNKLVMAITVAFTILLCLSVRLDWYGYDKYLPRQEQIAEIGVYHTNYRSDSRQYYRENLSDQTHPVNQMHITDTELAYQLLAGCVGTEQQVTGESSLYLEDMVSPEELQARNRREAIYVRVTLQSGKTYYRYYRISKVYEEVLRQVLESPEYVQVCYALDDDFLLNANYLQLESSVYNDLSERIAGENESFAGFARLFTEAYQRDIELHPEVLTTQGGNQLCTLDGRGDYYFCININENMTATLAALRSFGFEKIISPVSPEEVDRILLPVIWAVDADEEAEEWDKKQAAAEYGPNSDNPKVQRKIEDGSWVYSNRYGYCAVVKDPVAIRSILSAPGLRYRTGYSLFGGDSLEGIMYLDCPGYDLIDAWLDYEQLPDSVRDNVYFQ